MEPSHPPRQERSVTCLGWQSGMRPEYRARVVANRQIDIPFDDSRQRVVKGISLGQMPDRQGQFASWLEYSQHLANCVNRRWKEHHPEAAYYCVKCIGRERQAVRRGDVELCISEPKTVFRSMSGFHHLRRRIDPENLGFGADQSSYGQCWLSGARSNRS